MSAPDTILILDFGSQVTQLIARRVREHGAYCEIVPFQKGEEALYRLNPKGVILSGGPCSIGDEGSPRAPQSVFASGVPVLGICYGQQTLAAQLGGEVSSSDHKEFGRADVLIKKASPLFEGIWQVGQNYPVWMSHGDRVTALPEGFEVLATSEGAPFAVIANENKRYYGLMFHPEVVHTPQGSDLIRNFVRNIVGLQGEWTMGAYRERTVAAIRQQVGAGKVLCALSGGVDSAVAARLIYEAVGNQLTCVFVDHGFMRAGEADQVVGMFRETFHMPLVHVDASELFFSALDGVTDPETKRKTIGRLFIEVFEQEAAKIQDVHFLAQGTIYPDVIESVSFTGGPSVTIKSHHNVGGLPERMRMALVEPLRELFKDEVRVLGRELGLPASFVDRHPFPGPGLAIRVLGPQTRERVETCRQADKIFLDEIKAAGLYNQIWQAYAALLPVRSVGVMGDGRTYDEVVALRAVTSIDGMTADQFPFEPAFLGRVATRIINEVRGVNRVVYDVTSKPPATIEWE